MARGSARESDPAGRQESLSGALGRVSRALPGLHEAIPAHGSFPRTWGGEWGRMVAVSGTCRGHIRVHGTRTAVFRTPASGAVTRADVECVRSIGPPQPTFLTIDNLLSNN